MCSESIFEVDNQSTMRIIDFLNSCAVKSMFDAIDHLEIVWVFTFFNFDVRVLHALYFDIKIHATFDQVKVNIQLSFSLFS